MRRIPIGATLERYREVVMESAEFMASFALLRRSRATATCWDRR